MGQALEEVFKSTRLTREEVFITSKLWNTDHAADKVVRPGVLRMLLLVLVRSFRLLHLLYILCILYILYLLHLSPGIIYFQIVSSPYIPT